jgi:hypothetical protein
VADVYNFIANTGVIIVDSGVILTEVQDEYLSAFGSDLNLSPNTPQGILIATETLARTAVADNNATLANQINPNEAGGIFLDALMSLTGASRQPATSSLVNCTLTGVAGTSIPAGAQISDTSDNLYQIVSTTVIPVGGSISDVPFQSVLTGPIPGLANTLTTIVSNILGWETVTNPLDAVQGVSTQSDVQARLLRSNALAAQGVGIAEAIIAGLLLTSGVTSLTFQENATSSPATINSVPMVANSLYTCVAGTATLASIAETLTNKKSAGCAYNNGLGIPQSVNYTNPFSGQVIPVLFDTPSFVTVSIKVTVHQFTSVQNVQQAVINAVLAYANGTIPSESGFVVGADVSPFQIAGAVNILVPGLFVQKVEIAKVSFTQQGTIANTFNTVTGLTYNSDILVGMGVVGMGIPSSTTVASLVGSTGLTLSNTSTLSATEILTFTQSAVYQTTELPIKVWQQAITSASFITVIQV